MVTIRNKGTMIAQNAAYKVVRRSQERIASYRHFGHGDLSRYLESDAFEIMATRLTGHYFHRSKELGIYNQAKDLYVAVLIMAPILQRLPLSAKFDWHQGHVTSFVRRLISKNVNRCHFRSREIPRRYVPDLLIENLEGLGIHDTAMIDVLQDLHRCHAGGTTLRHLLAHQIFDPLFLLNVREGHELRFGNKLFRLERDSFEGSIDLRSKRATLLNFVISVREDGQRHLEIIISPQVLGAFQERIGQLLNSCLDPKAKIRLIQAAIHDLTESTRPARTARDQIKEVKIWLANKLRPLSATAPEAKTLPDILMNQWLLRVDSKCYFKKPTFFFDREAVDETLYRSFFSPYREVVQ